MNNKIKSFAAAAIVAITATIFAGASAAPALAAGNFALHFTGSSQASESEVLVFNGPALTKNFTISADVRWDGSAGYQGILSKAKNDGGNAQTGYCLCLANGSPVLALKDLNLNNRVYFAPTQLSVNEWHTVIATYDGEFSKIYVDGTLVGQSDSFGANLPVVQTGEQVVIGREFQTASDPDLASRAFTGDLDNLKTFDGVYPAALSPVMNYSFSEGTGKRIVDEGPLGSASWLSDNVTPQWVQGSDPVTLRYVSEGGAPVTKTVRPYDAITLENSTLFSRDGFTFTGWAVDNNSAQLNPGATFVMPLVSTEIAAAWEPVEVTVTKTDLAETGASDDGSLMRILAGLALVLLGFALTLRRKAAK